MTPVTRRMHEFSTFFEFQRIVQALSLHQERIIFWCLSGAPPVAGVSLEGRIFFWVSQFSCAPLALNHGSSGSEDSSAIGRSVL